MDASKSNIKEILLLRNSYYIPPFQRSYAWGKPQLERFFSDITRIIDSDLDAQQKDKLEHFFGTIVIKHISRGTSTVSIIVDGQQRITTSLLFIIALRDTLLKGKKDEREIEDLNADFLIENRSTYPDKIKLKQVTTDWNAYRALVKGEPANTGFINNAYNTFKKLITQYIEEKSNHKINIDLENFLNALAKLNIAVIALDERPFKGEDPQIIFETLNSLGKPLSLADLIRNYVLFDFSNDEDQTRVYEELWHPKIENLLLDKSSTFFRDYLQYKLSRSIKVVSDSNIKEIYQVFRNYAETHFSNKTALINDLIKYSSWYNWIVNPYHTDTISSDVKHNSEIKELLKNIFQDIKATAFIPFVLGLLEHNQIGQEENELTKLSDELLIKYLTIIRTYLIRRRVLKLTQGENKEIVLHCKEIPQIVTEEISLLQMLTTFIYVLRLPNDSEIRDGLSKVNFYRGLRTYSKFILGKIEENISKVSPDVRNSYITIEHIMPQKLSNEWKEHLGVNFNEIQEKYLDNIGNLILTEFNSEVSNNSFEVKKSLLQKSNLSLRNFVITKERWGEEQILEHQKFMIDNFLATFPLEEEFQLAQNWNISSNTTIRNMLYSPMDEVMEDIPSGTKPKTLIFDNIIYEVKSWKSLYLTFLKHIYLNYPDYFKIIYQNKEELLKRTDSILYYSSLTEKIDNRDITDLKYYQDFEGNTYNKDTHNSNNLYFYCYLKIDAIIQRINNVINRLPLNEDSVKIELAIKDNGDFEYSEDEDIEL